MIGLYSDDCGSPRAEITALMRSNTHFLDWYARSWLTSIHQRHSNAAIERRTGTLVRLKCDSHQTSIHRQSRNHSPDALEYTFPRLVCPLVAHEYSPIHTHLLLSRHVQI